ISCTMSYVSQTNISVELQYQEFLERVITFTLCTIPSCVFLFINGTMLFTLRSKSVFRDTCRYILLFNLLIADTAQLAVCQVLFLLSVCRITLTYPVCGMLTVFANITNNMISPLTLVVMPLERYVAVCYPLRHSSIITVRNTTVVIIAIWAVSSLNNLTRVLMFLEFSLEKMESWEVEDVCSNFALVLGAVTAEYDRAYTCVVFVSAGVATTFSYVSVIIAARSASTDKALAHKARNTLLLHLVQLGLSLSSTIYNPLIVALSQILTRVAFLWVVSVFYVCFIIFPRCLSSLIYGLRDQTIRPALLYYLCCRMKVK
uniref:G-protein coupled receptors family 1 profile domain-containing protein n=1 Tax=Poecilia formosa TaxID=48698 RepID=A0A087YRG6_POEFO